MSSVKFPTGGFRWQTEDLRSVETDSVVPDPRSTVGAQGLPNPPRGTNWVRTDAPEDAAPHVSKVRAFATGLQTLADSRVSRAASTAGVLERRNVTIPGKQALGKMAARLSRMALASQVVFWSRGRVDGQHQFCVEGTGPNVEAFLQRAKATVGAELRPTVAPSHPLSERISASIEAGAEARRRGYCHRNVEALIHALEAENPRLDPELMRVLVLTRPDDTEMLLEANMALLRQAAGAEAATFHVVLEYDGFVYDPGAAPEVNGLPAATYVETMFGARVDDLFVAHKNETTAATEREARKVRRQVIEEGSPVRSIAVLEVDVQAYLGGLCGRLEQVTPQFLWRELPKLPGVTVRSAPPPRPAEALSYEKSFREQHGRIEVAFNPLDLEIAECRNMQNAVEIKRPGERFRRTYTRTDFGLSALPYFFPADMADPKSLRGQVVIAMACGGGRLVEEWREHGERAFGVDLAFSEMQRSKAIKLRGQDGPVRLEQLEADQLFLKADAVGPPIAKAQVDVIYDVDGIFDAYMFSNKHVVVDALRNWRELLKPGGLIRSGAFDKTYEKEVRALIAEVPGIELVRIAKNAVGDPYGRCVELRRVG
jgi:SAM-dependent methyltransferase